MQKLATALSLASFAAACSTSATTSGNTTATCQAVTTAPATPPAGWGGTVFTIVMENHSRGDILGNAQAPFINQLAAQNAVADGYHDSYIHPSEPNYLWMVSGENFGVLDDADPVAHHLDSTSHVADQIEAAGLTWKTYQEGMGAPCGLVSHDRYAAKHNPFVYFNDINGWDGSAFQPSQRCNDHVVDYAQIDTDIANNTLPKYVFITPNLDHDMHDGTVAQGDTWLQEQVSKIIGTDAFNNGGVIFLLWDEGSNSADDPPFLAISPNAKPGFVSTVDYDTSSYLETVQDILGVKPLLCGDTAVSAMTDLFSMPMKAPSAP